MDEELYLSIIPENNGYAIYLNFKKLGEYERFTEAMKDFKLFKNFIEGNEEYLLDMSYEFLSG